MAIEDEGGDANVKKRHVAALSLGWIAAGVTVAVAATGAVLLAQRRDTGPAERRGPLTESPRADTAARRALGPPPRVDDREGWTRSHAGGFTGDPNDASPGPWRGPRGTLVFQKDDRGLAVLWADTAGLHFRDRSAGGIRTVIDMSSRRLRFGPGVEYEVTADRFFNYIAVGWKSDTGFTQWALVGPSGDFLWRKPSHDPSGLLIAMVQPSSKGECLIELTDDPEVRGHLELWDRRGARISRIKQLAETEYFVWSVSGETFSCYLNHVGLQPNELVATYNRRGEKQAITR